MSANFTATPERLTQALFGSHPFAEAVVAERNGEMAGGALFFHNYSTFLIKPGICMEDLFVQPNYRRQGVGRELLTYLAQQALSRQCGRLEWLVQQWNSDAVAFYQHLGAVILVDWRICCLDQEAIAALAASR
ncbi:GNAT family N-acetyltransferase [Oculatella sp. LEGE 06141]|nr:GNAT family N-acetyltransferase [Oculatella sp. LEGE 06141]